MRSFRIVILSPLLQLFPSVGLQEEQVQVQAFVPKVSVEAPVEGVPHWIARVDETKPPAAPIVPDDNIERASGVSYGSGSRSSGDPSLVSSCVPAVKMPGPLFRSCSAFLSCSNRSNSAFSTALLPSFR